MPMQLPMILIPIRRGRDTSVVGHSSALYGYGSVVCSWTFPFFGGVGNCHKFLKPPSSLFFTNLKVSMLFLLLLSALPFYLVPGS